MGTFSVAPPQSGFNNPWVPSSWFVGTSFGRRDDNYDSAPQTVQMVSSDNDNACLRQKATS